MNSSGVSLFTSQDKAAKDVLTLRRVDAAGEAAEVAAQMAEEALGQTGWARLREEFGDDLAGDVGEAEVAPLESIGELRMVDAQQVEHGGVEVVDLDRILDDVIA